MKLFIVSGVSGSGKSLCINALEDLNIYCIDNLPAGLLPSLVEYNDDNPSGNDATQTMGVGIDARNINSLKTMPKHFRWLDSKNINYNIIFLDATDDEIIKRYKESRRRHPIIGPQYSLTDAISIERELLKSIKEKANIIIDTTSKTPHQLRRQIRDYVIGQKENDLILRFESFGYKHGIPRDADYVFDVRCLPNPYWDENIRHLTGKDIPVIEFLQKHEPVEKMIHCIHQFLNPWLEVYRSENRSHLTIAIGCTGGKHRSVYISEQLAKRLENDITTQIHHRDIDLQSQ